MRAEFSEFQFAHSVTREIEDRLVFTNLNPGLPYIPNQRQEAAGGYDVAFEGPVYAVFLQYKLPEKLKRNTAKEWKEMGRPYFRIDIYPAERSAQHNGLCNLARKNEKNKVYYCAPAFIEADKFSGYCQMRCVAHNSVFIDCRSLPYITGKETHNICYCVNPPYMVMHSEPYHGKMELGWNAVLKQQFNEDTVSCQTIYEFIRNMESEEWFWREAEGNAGTALQKIGAALAAEGIQLLLLRA